MSISGNGMYTVITAGTEDIDILVYGEKIDNTTKIVVDGITHNGIFHADDVFATVVVAQVMAARQNLASSEVPLVRIQRKSDEPREELEANAGPWTMVYDIGDGPYDHHLPDTPKRYNGIPYASFGLLWKDFGYGILKRYYHCPDDILEKVWKTVEFDLVQGIDAADNGAKSLHRDPVKTMSVANVISIMNPRWDNGKSQEECFGRAVHLAAQILKDKIEHTISLNSAVSNVEKAISEARKGVMVLEPYCPWQNTLAASKSPLAATVRYVVFQSSRGKERWSVQCVPVAPGSFRVKKPVPKGWWGNAEATGVDGCLFVHRTGFLATFNGLPAALEYANKAMEYGKEGEYVS